MLELTAALTVADDLRVSYRVRNRGPEAAYVARLPIDAEFGAHPGSAYTGLTADGLGLTLLLGSSPTPVDEEVEFQAAALMALVPPGGEESGEITVPLPVREWNAYFTPDYDPVEEVPAYKVILVIEACQASDGSADEVPDHPGLFRVSGSTVDFLRAVLVPEHPIPVLRHPEEFTRY